MSIYTLRLLILILQSSPPFSPSRPPHPHPPPQPTNPQNPPRHLLPRQIRPRRRPTLLKRRRMLSRQPHLPPHTHPLSHRTHIARRVRNRHLEIHIAPIPGQLVQLPAGVEHPRRHAGGVCGREVGQQGEVGREEGVEGMKGAGAAGVEGGGVGREVGGGVGDEGEGAVAVDVK